MGERNQLIQELGITDENMNNHEEYISNNDISYSYHGDDSSYILRAEY